MAQQSNKRINIFDLAALTVILFVASIFLFSFFCHPNTQGKPVAVTIKVTSDDKAIAGAAQNQKEVYFDSSNHLLAVKKAAYSEGSLLITVIGLGEIKENGTIFNGGRILIGQKAEIHGNYFAQGIITSIAYED